MDDPGDDDKTPPRGKRHGSQWGDRQRAMVGRDHRAPSTDSERHRRSFRTSPDMIERELGGGAVGEIEPEVTKPWDLLDREQLNSDELEIVRRSRRDSSDPATYADIVKITARQARHIRELLDDRSTRKEQADAILELIKHPPNAAVLELQEDVKRIWRAFAEVGEQLGVPHSENKWTVQENVERGRTAYRWGYRLAGFALTLALGSATYVVAAIRSSGADEVLRAQDRHDIDELKQENKELRRSIERLKDKSP
jgi:hypothetical protein